MSGPQPSIHHLEVPRTARYALLGAPGPAVRELWIVLHGYRQLAPRFIRRFRRLAVPKRWIAAPESLNRFYVGDAPGRHGADARVGGTWMTREDRETEIRDYVRYLDRLHDQLQGQLPGPVPVVALGFSQGCHTVARWAVHGAARPSTVVLWGEVLPPDLDTDRGRGALSDTRLFSVQGRKDALVTKALLERQEEQARAMGIEIDCRWHSGGHVLDAETLGGLAKAVRGSPA